MTQYLVTAYDFTDTEAFNRRTNVRPHHLDGVREMKEKGNFIIGGAMLNEEGKMIGSTMIVQFETEEELEAWKKSDPYVTQGVWETVDIKPFKVAEV
ncbi:YciI family protein [Mucilaginibacter agri]|uniref:YCII-related domain-containing protein n=1 Tax=Mucilaginibacter agri TaxID=2695265 RepID=A0A966DSC6_9SPHI|nr:YciI family protein [Mucilaginibacter agri]NCD69998.1 hypothetical protein [Mucilaginibacter agri]